MQIENGKLKVENIKNSTKRTFIDLFAGVGGFRMGLVKAGFICGGHCEIDKYANASYCAMHEIKEGEWFADDIKRVKPYELPPCDIVTAGFPCQNISVAGRGGGLSGDRSGLFFEIIRLIKGKNAEDRPRWVVLENVRNLLSINEAEDFTTVLCALSEIGYDCEYQILNARDFGIPQNRERCFIIGHFRGRSGGKVFPITGTNGKNIIQIVGGRQGQRIYDPSGVGITITSTSGGMGGKTGLYAVTVDMTVNNPQITESARGIKARYNAGLTNRKADNSGVMIYPILTPERENKRQNGRRVKNEGEPMFCLTIQDRHGVLLVNSKNQSQNIRIRRLTPKECWRLMGIEDSLFEKARQVNSDTQLYKQAGNGVVSNVVYEIAKRLMECEAI